MLAKIKELLQKKPNLKAKEIAKKKALCES